MAGEIIIYRKKIEENLQSIQAKAPGKKIWIVCKANAYGVGEEAIQGYAELKNRYSIEGLAVATLKEALQVKKFNLPVLIMSGYYGNLITKENNELCTQNNFIPVIYAEEDLKKRLPEKYYIKLNSGMNRLGIDPFIAHKLNPEPYGVMSHFAESNLPHHVITERQVSTISWICENFKANHYSFSNSSAIQNDLIIAKETHVRPGISLYVGLEGNNCIFDWNAEIIQTRTVNKDETIAYAFTYIAPSQKTVALLGAGYADGIPRSLSNAGYFWLNNHKVSILGTVCMDLTVVDVSSFSVTRGEKVNLVKAGSSLRSINQFTGMIDYELLTGLSQRNERILR